MILINKNNKTKKNKINNKLARFISNNLSYEKKNLSNKKIIDKFNKLENSDKKSFKPSIDKNFKTILKSPKKFEICKDMFHIKLDDKCYYYTNSKVKDFLKENLNRNKLVDCNKIIPPRQFLSNCWFNTLFVSFFISDKGRKFFKFFRNLMINGELSNGKKINKELAKAFYLLNLAIEASYNKNLTEFAYNFNTNLLIKKIYENINKNSINPNIYNINEPGNPLAYYLNIINYLDTDNLKINIFDNINIYNIKEYYDKKIEKMADMIILIYDEEYGKNNNNVVSFKINNIEYKLDSAIVRDTNKQHFCSLLTCNNNEYSYDGASFTMMKKFDWKNIINKNINWKFKGHNLKWNFKNGYQILFYYRIN